MLAYIFSIPFFYLKRSTDILTFSVITEYLGEESKTLKEKHFECQVQTKLQRATQGNTV